MFKRRLTTLAIAAALLLGIAAPAMADHRGGQNQDGLVNIVITELVENVVVNVEDVDVAIGVAANLAANICGVQVGDIAVLAAQVNRGAQTQTVACEATGGTITLEQNAA